MENNYKYDRHYEERLEKRRQKKELIQYKDDQRKLHEEFKKRDDYYQVGIIEETLEQINSILKRLNSLKDNNFDRIMNDFELNRYLSSLSSHVKDLALRKELDRQNNESAKKALAHIIQKEENYFNKIKKKYEYLSKRLDDLEEQKDAGNKFQTQRQRFLRSIKREEINEKIGNQFYVDECIRLLRLNAWRKEKLNLEWNDNLEYPPLSFINAIPFMGLYITGFTIPLILIGLIAGICCPGYFSPSIDFLFLSVIPPAVALTHLWLAVTCKREQFIKYVSYGILAYVVVLSYAIFFSLEFKQEFLCYKIFVIYVSILTFGILWQYSKNNVKTDDTE